MPAYIPDYYELAVIVPYTARGILAFMEVELGTAKDMTEALSVLRGIATHMPDSDLRFVVKYHVDGMSIGEDIFPVKALIGAAYDKQT